MFTWGTPVTTIALFTFLLHLGIETKTWVRTMGEVTLPKGPGLWATQFPAGRFYIQEAAKLPQLCDKKANDTYPTPLSREQPTLLSRSSSTHLLTIHRLAPALLCPLALTVLSQAVLLRPTSP